MTVLWIKEGSRCFSLQVPKRLHLLIHRGSEAILIITHLQHISKKKKNEHCHCQRPATQTGTDVTGTETAEFSLSATCPAQLHHVLPQVPERGYSEAWLHYYQLSAFAILITENHLRLPTKTTAIKPEFSSLAVLKHTVPLSPEMQGDKHNEKAKQDL